MNRLEKEYKEKIVPSLCEKYNYGFKNTKGDW